MRLYEGETMKKYSVVICGGGSTYTPDMIELLCMMQRDFPLKKVVLYDNDEERQRPVGEFGKIMFSEYYPGLEFKYTLDKEEAFKDIDFAFVQIRAGGMEQRNNDEKIPYKYGVIGQETCGPGGLAYGVRSVVQMVELIEDIRKYSKDAWIINYSNPAAIVAEATKRKFPDDKKLVNICDMPIAIIDLVAAALEIKDKKNIVYDYFGLNHFGWFTNIEYKGESIMEPLKAYIKEHEILLPASYLKGKESLTSSSNNTNRHAKGSWYYVWKGVYEILENFPEYIPNTYLNYYLQSKEFVEHSNVEHTRANEVMETREKNLFDGIDHYLQTGEIDEKVFYAGSHGDWIADLAIALKNDTKARFLVIVENKGALPNMPYDAMVEVPAYIGKDGPEVISQKPIPLFQQGLMMQQLNSEKLLVEGCIEGSYEKVLQAFTLNKTVPSMNVAKAILDDMIEANKGFWPELK